MICELLHKGHHYSTVMIVWYEKMVSMSILAHPLQMSTMNCGFMLSFHLMVIIAVRV